MVDATVPTLSMKRRWPMVAHRCEASESVVDQSWISTGARASRERTSVGHAWITLLMNEVESLNMYKYRFKLL